jgi:hypothetical protein
VGHPQIAAFARLANGAQLPERVVAGQKTLLGRTMHDIRYDAPHDEFVVTNPFAQAVLTFRGSANGEEPPVRMIQGPHTQLAVPDTLEIDTVHNELFVPDSPGQVHVYPLDAKGDVAPLRNLRTGGNAIAVDPIHNVLVTAASIRVNGETQEALRIFNRTDEGDAKPIRTIAGPHTGLLGGTRQFAVYPEGGWIVVTQSGGGGGDEPYPPNPFVGVWSINDNGDVPPRWKITTVVKKPRSITFDPKHKELIVGDMTLNAVLTYSLPEMFAPNGK